MRTRYAIALLIVLVSALPAGCGRLFPTHGASPITFEAGELRSNVEVSLDELDLACRQAIETLGYEQVETTQDAKRILWRARTASGDAVELQLAARTASKTELRIRVGVLGNEARSRLILEQIHQSL